MTAAEHPESQITWMDAQEPIEQIHAILHLPWDRETHKQLAAMMGRFNHSEFLGRGPVRILFCGYSWSREKGIHISFYEYPPEPPPPEPTPLGGGVLLAISRRNFYGVANLSALEQHLEILGKP